jgi:hypothetical protein
VILWYTIVTVEQKVKTKGKPIKLRASTVARLDKLKHKGQSYDGIVAELIDHYEKKEGEGEHPV